MLQPIQQVDKLITSYLTIDDAFQYLLKEKHMYCGQIQLGLYLTVADMLDILIYPHLTIVLLKLLKKIRIFCLLFLTLFMKHFCKMLLAIVSYNI